MWARYAAGIEEEMRALELRGCYFAAVMEFWNLDSAHVLLLELQGTCAFCICDCAITSEPDAARTKEKKCELADRGGCRLVQRAFCGNLIQHVLPF